MIEKHIQQSHPLEYQDLDWEEARRISLTDREKMILRYSSDIENQTIFYMLELLGTGLASDNDALSFLTIWNYEEFYHGYATAKLLEECGAPLDVDRRCKVREEVTFLAKAENIIQRVLGHLMPESFAALYLAWGASQEFLTTMAYEAIADSTKNPVLRELCQRIAKQERKHFAWYFNSARNELEKGKMQQRVARTVFKRFWSPVGVGVKTKTEAKELLEAIFPGDDLGHSMSKLESKLSQLPGLSGLRFATNYVSDLYKDDPERLRGN